MNVFIIAVLIATSQDRPKSKALYAAYNESVNINSKKEADCLIENLNMIKKTKNYLDATLICCYLSDLNIISGIESEARDRIFRLIHKIFSETNMQQKNPNLNEHLQTEIRIKKLEEIFGRDSFYVAYFNMRFLIYKIIASKNKNFYKEIEGMALDYENKFGLVSILTSETYSGICIAAEKYKYWSALNKNAEKLLEIQTRQGLDGYEIIMPVSFLVKSSVMLGNNFDVKRYNDIINIFVLEPLDSDNLRPQLRIFSSMATVYVRQNKLTNAIAMQEMAIAAACEIFNSDSPQAKEQALILRELLAKNKEFTSMRNLEDRFKLTPLPQQKGEK